MTPSVPDITPEQIESLYKKLKKEAEDSGYFLNPDGDFARDLVRGLIVNTGRYGYPSCPCRLASGIKQDDTDIICPCDYRDPDLGGYNACYCALYVSEKALKGEAKIKPVPERRPPPGMRRKDLEERVSSRISSSGIPVWRCKVCGYLCAREQPPEICPICKAKKDRFERL